MAGRASCPTSLRERWDVLRLEVMNTRHERAHGRVRVSAEHAPTGASRSGTTHAPTGASHNPSQHRSTVRNIAPLA